MMKKLAAVAAVSCCAVASAQSNVSIYGRADIGLTNQTNRSTGGTVKSVANSVWNPSQIGVRGQEDIGGGLKAVFDLSSTVVFDTGSAASATKFWDRNAYVGLTSPTWGSLYFGRQINTLADTFYIVDPLGARAAATNMNVRFGYLGGPGTTIANNFGPNPGVAGASLDRVDNAVKYSWRNENFSAIAMAAAGEGNGGRAAGGMLGYDGGPISVRGAYMAYKDNADIPFKAYSAGVSYRLSTAFTFRLSYTDNKIDSGLASIAKPYRDMQTKVVATGAIWTVAPMITVNLAYYRGTRSQDGLPRQVAQKLYLAPEYQLSKRTSLVAVLIRERFNGTGAALDTGTPLSANASGSVYVGAAVTHAF